MTYGLVAHGAAGSLISHKKPPNERMGFEIRSDETSKSGIVSRLGVPK